MSMGTPLASTSNTAERAFDCMTICSSSSGCASPAMSNETRIASKHLFRQAENAAQVDVALDRRFGLGEPDTARRGDICDASREAGCNGVQQPLDRGRRGVGAAQHHRVIAFGTSDRRRFAISLYGGCR